MRDVIGKGWVIQITPLLLRFGVAKASDFRLRTSGVQLLNVLRSPEPEARDLRSEA
jgi:hypothetical protein